MLARVIPHDFGLILSMLNLMKEVNLLRFINLKHCIPNIKPCNETLSAFHFPEAMQHNFVLKFHTHFLE